MLLLFVDLTALAVLDNGLGRQSIVGGGSIYPFGHNVLLAARNEGLGGVLTTIICREEASTEVTPRGARELRARRPDRPRPPSKVDHALAATSCR